MEPLLLDIINRNAYLVKAKQPFIDWCNQFTDEPYTEMEEGHVYLGDDTTTQDEMQAWLRKNFHTIFTNELQDWNESGDSWPPNRTYELFSEWFTTEFHSLIFDLGTGGIEKE